jgi:hypothetical protein
MSFRFQQILLPCEDNLLRKLTLNRPAFRVARYESLPLSMENAISNVIFNEVRLYRRILALKQELVYAYDFSTYAAFRTIDRFNEGLLNIDNLKHFYRNNYRYLSDKEALAIIRRIDTDGDA